MEGSQSATLLEGTHQLRPRHLPRKTVHRVAVGQVVIREKEYPVALRPYEGAMVMETLYYGDEVRALSALEELPVQTKVHPNERKMAIQLIENLAMEFNIEEFKDEYRE